MNPYTTPARAVVVQAPLIGHRFATSSAGFGIAPGFSLASCICCGAAVKPLVCGIEATAPTGELSDPSGFSP